MSERSRRPKGRSRLKVLLFLGLIQLCNFAVAAPTLALPLNSQVPLVARAGKPYRFVFAESTFSSSSSALQYRIEHGPPWLRLDSPNRALSGTPDTASLGPFNFSLTASDFSGSTSDSVTLIVSDNAGPSLGKPLSQQLPALGQTSDPNTLLLRPATPLSIKFGFDTFTNVNPTTHYYAICANNTPLPSWMSFNAVDLSFTGTAPRFDSPDVSPQEFDIHLTASDIAGFSAAVATFHITVETHELKFGSQQLLINATAGQAISYNGLQTALTLDGSPVKPGDLKDIKLQGPRWLSVDPASLKISGIPPAKLKPQSFMAVAKDIYGDIANTTVFLSAGGSTSLVVGSMPALHATIGEHFSFTFTRDLFSAPTTNVAMDLGNASSWLIFDPDSMTLSGDVPPDTLPQIDSLKLTATLGTATSTTQVRLIVQVKNGSPSSPSASASSAPSSTSVSQDPVSSTAAAASSSSGDSDPSKVAIKVVMPIVGVLALLFCYWLLMRRRKEPDKEGEKRSLMDRFRHHRVDSGQFDDLGQGLMRSRSASRRWSLPRINSSTGLFTIALPPKNRQSPPAQTSEVGRVATRAPLNSPVEESEWETILPEPKVSTSRKPASRRTHVQLEAPSRNRTKGPRPLALTAKYGFQPRHSVKPSVRRGIARSPMPGLGHGRGSPLPWVRQDLPEHQRVSAFNSYNDSGIGRDCVDRNGNFQLQWPNATAARNPRHAQQRSEGWSTVDSNWTSSEGSSSNSGGSCWQHPEHARPSFRNPPHTGSNTVRLVNAPRARESSLLVEPSLDGNLPTQDETRCDHLSGTRYAAKASTGASERSSSWTYELNPEDRRSGLGFSSAPRGSLSAQRKGLMMQNSIGNIANHTYRIVNRFTSSNSLASDRRFEDPEDNQSSIYSGDIWEDDAVDEDGRKVWRKAGEGSNSAHSGCRNPMSMQRLSRLMGQYRERHAGNDLTLGTAGKKPTSVQNQMDVERGMSGSKSCKGSITFPEG